MYIAVLDIGRTKAIAAILDEKGAVLVRETLPPVVAGHEMHLDACVQAMKHLMRQMALTAGDFVGLGAALPGIVNHESGVLVYMPYTNCENIAVAEFLAANIGISKVRCENDVNACAIGELRFGLGRIYSDFIWMAVDTGVGGAVVEGSKLVHGGHGFAGELGHLKVEYKAPAHCPCGQFGCLEVHGSNTALIRETRMRRLESPAFAGALEDMGLKPDGTGCLALAKAGNPDALEIMDRMGTYLGRGISYCINILNTQAIVIGGHAAASMELLIPSIRASIQQNALKRIQDIDIVKTTLGPDASLLGAAALVLEQ